MPPWSTFARSGVSCGTSPASAAPIRPSRPSTRRTAPRSWRRSSPSPRRRPSGRRRATRAPRSPSATPTMPPMSPRCAPPRHGWWRSGCCCRRKRNFQAECITQLVRDVFIKHPQHHANVWIQSAGIERDLDVGQIIVGGNHQRARVMKSGCFQRLLLARVHQQNRDSHLLCTRKEGRLCIFFDHHHIEVPKKEPFQNPISDVTEPAQDDVIAIGRCQHAGPLLLIFLARKQQERCAHQRICDHQQSDERIGKVHRSREPFLWHRIHRFQAKQTVCCEQTL